ncbi:SdrD B-like domain-containing protein [Nocardioides humi]|uniref:SdrD B-like domain-containing protein n=1 Tax=Nocardioides humi TaxID=449461 RepID=UPI0011265EC3|nr:SdrD B-like domain-containing protein [Nocardioides humi]
MKRWFEQVRSSLPTYPARRLTALAVAASGLAVLGGTQVAAPAQAAPGDGTIKVRVVQDYNGDGGWDDPFIEPGLAGVTVRVTDEAGVTQDLTTDGDGLVEIVGAPGSYRIVAVNPDPATLQPAPAREKTGTADTPAAKWLSPNEEFITVGANQTVQMTTAFWDSGDYCQSNPLIVTACQPPMFNSGGGAANNATGDTLVTAPYRAEGADVAKTTLSTKSETGALYGIGYRRQDRRVFAGAYAKRGSDYGPGGAGAIYVTDASGGPATLWGTVPNVGTRAHTNDTLPGGRLDWNFAPAVGKESLGDLDVSEDGDDLQVINLFTRELYVYDASAATMGAPTHVVDLSANPGCAAASDWRPGALGERKGVLYVGGVCSAESTQSAADVRAIVLSYDADTYAPIGTVMDQPLTAKRQGSGAGNGGGCNGRDMTTYRPWNDEGITCTNKNGQVPDPQAWLSDIVVENNGDLILGFRDRTGDQQLGLNSIWFADTTGTGGTRLGLVNYNAEGDINKACPTATSGGMFVLDMNGACGIAAVPAGQEAGEYFTGDRTAHNEPALGGLALSRGERGVATTIMDPAGFWTQGYASISRGTGRALDSAGDGSGPDPDEVLHDGDNWGNRLTGADGFGKGQGMADMEVLCEFAPIQIGNRVWNDENGDGIQDPGEDGIAGVTVNLYDPAGNLVATKVTNSRGEYYFDSINDGVGFNTDYVIRLDKPEDYTGNGKLAGVGLTDEDQGTGPEQDRLDSDGTLVGGYPEASITTGNRGENDHTIDFGFKPASVSVGDFVWIDSDGNGIQDPGESGLEGWC